MALAQQNREASTIHDHVSVLMGLQTHIGVTDFKP